MSILVILLIQALLIILVVSLNLNSKEDFLHYQKQKIFLNNFNETKKDIFQNLDNYINEANPPLISFLGQSLSTRLIVPLCIILSLALLVIGPYLAGFKYGLILGFIIFLAYAGRWIYHLASNFRQQLLDELSRLLISIRNNLSSGQSLDHAINKTNSINSSKPIQNNLNIFINNNSTNLIQNFPEWLKLLEKQYRIPELNKFSQLLALELKHNNNQEEAFINTISCICEKEKQNKKQKNTIKVTFLTLDFMVLAFLGVLFLVIPNLSFSSEINWWQSERRYLVVFGSGLIIWLAYASTIFISFWRSK